MLIETIGDKCTGCGACQNGCKNNCIKMVSDKEGFLKPVISSDNCIKCGECEKNCQAIQRENLSEINQITKYCTYVGYSRDSSIQKNSTSGGVFFEIAKKIIQLNGIVYGASFDQCYHLKHVRVDSLDKLSGLCGSKYVQSEIGLIYRTVKKDLDSKKIVLFSGCGCQIAGLKSYLGKNYNNLYTVAIICHGVPSPGVWDSYITKFKDVIKIDFRDKAQGWLNHFFSIKTEKKSFVWNDKDNPYMYAFINDIIIRKSCFECKFKSYRCDADIMIGDAWGVQNYCRKIYDNQGTSLILEYTVQGKKLLDCVSDKLRLEQINSIEIYKNNPRIIKSIKINRERIVFSRLSKYIPKLLCVYLLFIRGKINEKKSRNINIS